jgi:hypothetical protein
VKASSDTRPESYKLNSETVKGGDKIGTSDTWRARRDLIKPLVRASMCEIHREQDRAGHPTLGVFRPGRIKRLVLESTDAEWSPQERTILGQDDLFRKTPTQTLEKIPFKFIYEFDCSDAQCKGHRMSCTDWEMAQAYRRWRRQYGDDWEARFRERFESDMIEKYDTHFFVGTVHKHPKNWIVVGLFYPPKRTTGDLFE